MAGAIPAGVPPAIIVERAVEIKRPQGLPAWTLLYQCAISQGTLRNSLVRGG